MLLKHGPSVNKVAKLLRTQNTFKGASFYLLKQNITSHRNFSTNTFRLPKLQHKTIFKTSTLFSLTKQQTRYYSTPNVTEIAMPALSPTMKEGTIASWNVKPGDELQAGDVIASIQTDKAVVELEAQEPGFVAKLYYEAGASNIPIGTTIALVVESKEEIEQVKDYQPKGTKIEAKPEEPKEEVVEEVQKTTEEKPVVKEEKPDRIIASPYAKKLAAERGINLADVKGTGPKNRIIAADVEEYKPTLRREPRREPTPSVEGLFTDIPVSMTRKVIAERLLESKRTIPHYYLTVSCEVDELMKVRSKLNKEGEKKGFKLSVNDFIIKAAARALKVVPAVNSSWRGDTIRQYHTQDISNAVATDTGLITPIVKDAGSKGLVEIASDMKTLSEKARAGTLAPEEFMGGTFTISNLGMFGIKEFSAIINPPQAAILAVGGAEKTVKAVEKDGKTEFKVVTTMSVTLSCDHRVIDGAVGAQWLQVFKESIENPLFLLL